MLLGPRQVRPNYKQRSSQNANAPKELRIQVVPSPQGDQLPCNVWPSQEWNTIDRSDHPDTRA